MGGSPWSDTQDSRFLYEGEQAPRFELLRASAKHCRTTEAMLKLPLWRTLRGHCCASATGLTGSKKGCCGLA
jgi:hypothetical protein